MEANIERSYDAHTAHVLSLLGKKIPKDVDGLREALRDTEACYIRTLTVKIAAQSALYTERDRLRFPKDKDYTDWDRKIMLDAATVDKQAHYDKIAGIEKALEQRISVIQALLIQ